MTLEAKVCNYTDLFKCEMCWILPKLAIFIPVPTSTQDVLAITLITTLILPHITTLISPLDCSVRQNIRTVVDPRGAQQVRAP